MNNKIVTALIFLFFIKFLKCEVVRIMDGYLEGTVMKSRKGVDFHAFLKVPFAEPPVGNLRFQPPVPNKKWEETLNATKFGPICMQNYKGSDFEMSEDCLHLNVFTKNLHSDDKKPVIVYIHGGGFTSGSALFNLPDYLLDRDIVLVTLNYRLGPFGFLATGTRDAVGNMGLKDQNLALKWVERNIIHFGGDFTRITLAGLSAGGFSVTAHIVSEMSRGFFHKAITMSGAVTWQIGFEKDNAKLSQEVGEKLNCSTNLDELVPCLQKKSAGEILLAGSRSYYGCLVKPWLPVIEPDFGQERFFADDPIKLLKSGNFTKVPVIIGITADEFVGPVAALLSNNESLALLNNNFAEITSKCFYYKENSIKTTSEIATILRNYYLPFGKIDRTSFNSLALLSADGSVGYGVHRFVQYVSAYEDVYYYKFSYIGRYSSFYYPKTKPYGAHHADDNQYVLASQNPPKIKETDPENFMLERMTRIWEQFAKSGNPNNPEDEFLADMNWPKYSLDNEYFMDIGNHMVEKQGLYLERYRIWDDLENFSVKLFSGSVKILTICLVLINKLFF